MTVPFKPPAVLLDELGITEPHEIVIEAIGNGPNPLIPKTTPGLTTTRHGTLVVDEATMMTTRKGVFAGGDIVAGASTVILAMGHGRKAASAIDAYLRASATTEVPAPS